MVIRTIQNINTAVDEMSAQELRSLINYANSKLQEKMEGAKQALIEDMRSKAGELGLTFEDLFQSRSFEKKSNQKRGIVPVKFRGPSGETWSGRGRTPRWMQALMDTGHQKEEFEV